jgi:hypothetical protein
MRVEWARFSEENGIWQLNAQPLAFAATIKDMKGLLHNG